jgi:hypothetical protein
VDRAIAFAASKGYSFTADEAEERMKTKAAAMGKEITDAELDGVAGDIAYLRAALASGATENVRVRTRRFHGEHSSWRSTCHLNGHCL